MMARPGSRARLYAIGAPIFYGVLAAAIVVTCLCLIAWALGPSGDLL